LQATAAAISSSCTFPCTSAVGQLLLLFYEHWSLKDYLITMTPQEFPLIKTQWFPLFKFFFFNAA